jgi:hypothetical protein
MFDEIYLSSLLDGKRLAVKNGVLAFRVGKKAFGMRIFNASTQKSIHIYEQITEFREGDTVVAKLYYPLPDNFIATLPIRERDAREFARVSGWVRYKISIG